MGAKVPWALLVAAGVFLWQLDGCRQREIGELRGQNAELLKQQGEADTVWLTQLDTVKVVRTRTDSILQTDTVFHRDTVIKIVEAERAACNALVETCEERVRLRDLRYANLEKQLPNWFERNIGCAAGASAGDKGLGLGVTCGYRFP